MSKRELDHVDGLGEVILPPDVKKQKLNHSTNTEEEIKLNESTEDEDIAVGIDLGTTYSCVGVWENSRVEIIANIMGNKTTPSYVAFTDTQRLVGEAAKNQVAVNPSNTVFDAKRLIGRSYEDESIQADIIHWPFTVIKGKNGLPSVQVQWKGKSRVFAPEEISAMVLSSMKTTAESYLGKKVKSAVITVPAYFNDAQRQSTKDAGAIAGLKVLRIINEPTAAAIAYGLDRQDEEGETKVLIFDLGGGTFDVSLLSIEKGIFEVMATAGHTHLGGEDFDNRMVDYMIKDFTRKHKRDPTKSSRSIRRLRTACERAKRKLSNQLTADIEVDSLYDGIDYSTTLSRAKFEELCMDMFKSTMAPVRRVLGDAQVKAREVHEVVLVGGSTRIPKVQQLLSEFFNGKTLNKSVNQDEAVAFGATVQAAILSGAATGSGITDGVLLLDVLPLSLGVETAGGVMTKIIKRNSTVPIRREQTFSTNVDNQDGVDISVYEGERGMATDNHLLGSFSLLGIPPMPRGVPQIEVTFDIDSDGLLSVSAVETSTGTESKVRIENDKAALTPADVARMVQEAEENKIKDVLTQAAVEARGDLESYAYEVYNLLQGDDKEELIPEEERDALMEVVEDVMEWLEESVEDSVDEYLTKKQYLKSAAKAVTDRLFPPPPRMALGTVTYSASGSLIEFID